VIFVFHSCKIPVPKNKKTAFLSNTNARKAESTNMKTVVFASQKGGVGKTTLTAHLAVAAEIAGDGPCVLIDTDPQASLAAWWNGRTAETPKFAPMALKELSEKLVLLGAAGFAYAFIDTPPAITESIRTVVEQADFVLIPTRPSPHDLRAVGHTVDLVAEAHRPFAFAVTQAKANSRLTVQTMAALSAHGVVAPAIVHDRVDYAASMTDGRTVLEVDPKGRSAAEVAELWQFVKTRMNESTKAR
jgi:chromosome partitioning protein